MAPRGPPRHRSHGISVRAWSTSFGSLRASRFFGRPGTPLSPRAGRGGEPLSPGPIRGELLGAEQLAERVTALARGQRLAEVPDRHVRLLARLAETRRILEDAHARLAAAAAAEDVNIGPAGD